MHNDVFGVGMFKMYCTYLIYRMSKYCRYEEEEKNYISICCVKVMQMQ